MSATAGNFKHRLLLIANTLAALAIAAFVMLTTFGLDQIWNPGAYGTFGVSFLGLQADSANGATLETVTAGSPAQKAGLRAGDIVRPVTPDDSSLLLLMRANGTNLPVGRVLRLWVVTPVTRHLVTIRALPLGPLSASDAIALILLYGALVASLAIALWLMVFHANRMTWGFYLFTLFFFQNYTESNSIFASQWGAAVDIAGGVIMSASAVGLFTFCVRFPTNTPHGWQRKLDNAMPYALAVMVALFTWMSIAQRNFAPFSVRITLFYVLVFLVLTVMIAGPAILIRNYLAARGIDRQKIKWVIFGLACNLVAFVVYALTLVLSVVNLPSWFPLSWEFTALALLSVVLPLAVAYATVRHRVIDVRFVLSRSLVFGGITVAIAVLILGLEWLLSSKLPTSRFQVAIIAGVALFVGFLLNTARQRIGTSVDALFFGKWHRRQERAATIGAELRRAGSKAELHQLLTMKMADAFTLSSAALFERTGDEGFVRVAACGWPPSALWHILPADQLAQRAREHLKITNIDSLQWREPETPSGTARPSVIVPIAVGKNVAALLLLGAHEDSTVLDPDELRVIRRLCADAGPVYALQPTPQSSRPDFLSEPLGA
ncbi:MAG: hypothetical protein JO195_06675 [Candidatus Eremiobacteraeota bacterium]|nr:hypothetical protein [Candidatus Eremiobacteraeota bacterium]